MSGENVVRKLHSAPDEEVPSIEKMPGLGVSVQVDFGAGRACVFQTYVERDCSQVELNKMLDKIARAGDRQRAHYENEALYRDLKKLEKEHAQGELDLQKLDDDFEAQQKGRAAEIEKLGQTVTAFQAAHSAAAAERGVRNPERVRSNDKANADKIESRIKDLKADIQVAPDTFKQTRRQAEIAMEHRLATITRTKAEIERNEQIVADGLKV